MYTNTQALNLTKKTLENILKNKVYFSKTKDHLGENNCMFFL